MRFLVTGSAGLLGRQITRVLAESSQVISCYHKARPDFGIPTPLDLSRTQDIEDTISRARPDVIFHCAAVADADMCEADKETALRINTGATEDIARQAAKLKSFLVYVSTDQVFDGRQGMRRESDVPNPLNHYGITKLKGEKAVQELATKWCIARTSMIYGIHPTRDNFLVHVAEALKKKEKFPALVDQYSCPTYLPNLSKMLAELGTRQIAGMIHLAGATRISRYDMAKMVSERLGLDSKLLVPSRMSEMKNWRAPRPRDSSLDTSKAQKILKEKPLGFEEGLGMYLRQLKPKT